MKLKLTVLALAGAMALSASAQTETRATRIAYEKSTSHNWFITFQGGASILGNGDNGKAKFADRLTFTPSLAVGKWHSPYYATRIKASFGEAKSFYNNSTASLQQHENYFVGAHYDFMVDLVNLLSSYPNRNIVRVNPFVGLGYEYKFDSSLKYKDVHAATANAGLQLAFRLSQRVLFALEGEATWNGLQLSNSYPTEYANNLRLGASAGLSFVLGKVGFKPVTPLDEALVANLNGQINALRAENAELAKRPTHCPDVVTEVAPVSTASHFLADKSILFAHGKSTVSKDQLITIFDASEFAKNHGEVVVTGYTQKSESRFAGLAEKRAQAVARVLTEDYGVPSEKITIEYKDASEAPFAGKEAAWNRVVIIRSK